MMKKVLVVLTSVLILFLVACTTELNYEANSYNSESSYSNVGEITYYNDNNSGESEVINYYNDNNLENLSLVGTWQERGIYRSDLTEDGSWVRMTAFYSFETFAEDGSYRRFTDGKGPHHFDPDFTIPMDGVYITGLGQWSMNNNTLTLLVRGVLNGGSLTEYFEDTVEFFFKEGDLFIYLTEDKTSKMRYIRVDGETLLPY